MTDSSMASSAVAAAIAAITAACNTLLLEAGLNGEAFKQRQCEVVAATEHHSGDSTAWITLT
jgi:hypothetical protein